MKIFAFAMLLCAPIYSQVRGTTPPETTANLPAQKIGPRDLVTVHVYDSPELSRSIRVGSDGTIKLPMLKDRVKAEGLMPNELEVVIAKALEDEGLLVEPSVTVTVAEYSSRPISVAGSVRTPLTFQANSPVTLLEALTRAGGLTSDAGSEILISKSQPGPDGAQTSLIQRVAVKSLIDAADPDSNLKLSGGEEIRVPEAGKVFVVGNVNKPGAFSVQDGGETSVLKLLALAEGLSRVRRQAGVHLSPGGFRVEERNSDRAQQDHGAKVSRRTLLSSDVLYIPDNKNGRLGMAVLEKLLMFGSTAGATALIYNRVR